MAKNLAIIFNFAMLYEKGFFNAMIEAFDLHLVQIIRNVELN